MKTQIRIMIALFALLPAMYSCNPVDETEKPNVVLIVTDDQGWGDLSLHGNTNLETPSMDRIALNGARFEYFYACPVCSPTRAELLTGRKAPRCGIHGVSKGGERIDLDETTMGEIFKSAGYATAAYGKWHSGMQPPYHPNARGFDDFYGFCSGHWGDYFSPLFLEHNGELVQGDGYITDDFTNRALAFLDKNQDRPFLLYVPYCTPHVPMQVPDRWMEKQLNQPVTLRHREPEKEDSMYNNAAWAMVENLDWNIGKLMAKLDQLNLTDNTIVLFMSDNGPWRARWNGGMKGQKGSTDEGGIRVPLHIQWPGTIDAGITIPQISSAVDLLPTLTDLTGIDYSPEKKLDGKSLKPLLMGDDSNWEERTIVTGMRRTSVRSQRFRLDAANHLFDMEEDIGQYVDVSENYPDEKKRLIEAREIWKRDVYSELPEQDLRTLPVGHPDFNFTQLPARDGVNHGNIVRSCRHPNDSHFTNWISEDDYISWDIEVLETGEYDVELYHTCKEENIGHVLELSFGSAAISKRITEAHDPPLRGPENDYADRIVSLVKDFTPIFMGTIHLEKGIGQMTLRASEMKGNGAIDFRLMMINRNQ